jgi:pyroglutamyl-peptidase
MERIAHKLGYHMKDATGKLAPVVKVAPKYFSRREDAAVGPAPTIGSSGSGGMHVGGGNLPSAAEIIERERLGIDHVEGGDTNVRPTRGFGATYETFPDEITTSIDVTRLVHDLKRSGVEVSMIFFGLFRF